MKPLTAFMWGYWGGGRILIYLELHSPLTAAATGSGSGENGRKRP